ncbi:MAG: hypothetical protein ACR2P7_06250 [bacterium]
MDGANRGSGTRIELRQHVDKNVKGRLLYTYPFLGYYEPQVCKRLSDIGIKVGQVVEVYHMSHLWYSQQGIRHCTSRYTLKNTGTTKHIFAQVGGRTIWDSNCNFKTDWALPHHERDLLTEAQPEDPNERLGDKDYDISVRKKPILAGTYCVDGANRGAAFMGRIREFRGRKKGALVRQSSPLGYYTATECFDLSAMGLAKHQKVTAWWANTSNLEGVCRGRNVIENDGSQKTVWIQIRGAGVANRYCETKRTLDQPPLQ